MDHGVIVSVLLYYIAADLSGLVDKDVSEHSANVEPVNRQWRHERRHDDVMARDVIACG